MFFVGTFLSTLNSKSLVFSKGQIISKWFIGVFDYLPEKTNENKSIWGIIVVKSNSFVRFLGEIENIKETFWNYLTFNSEKSVKSLKQNAFLALEDWNRKNNWDLET